jgi:EmrB/QacA subfamily drug resistance transporter
MTRPRAVFLVTVTGAFVVSLDLSIVNVAFPSIQADFADASTATLAWTLSAYSVVFGALLLGAGRIADRSGRRKTFLVGLGIFTAASAVCGLAPDPWVLVGGRAVQAVGAALLLPSAMALLLQATPAEARARTVALWGGISALAVAAGPTLGSLLIDAGGWRWAFIVNLPVAAVAAFFAHRVLDESATGGPMPDLVGVAVVSIAMASLALAVTQGHEWGWTSGGVLASFLGAAVLGPLAVRRSRRHPAPAIDVRIFEHRTAVLANAATLAYAIGFFAMFLANVLFLTEVWGYSTLRAGLAIAPSPLMAALFSTPGARLAARFGYARALVFGTLTYAAGLVFLAAALPTEPHYLAGWLPGSLIVGIGIGLTFPVLSAASVAGLPADRFAAGGATNHTARQLGAVFGVAMLVSVLGDAASPDRFRAVWWVCAGTVLVAGAISAFHRVEPAVEPRPETAAFDRRFAGGGLDRVA